MSTVITKFDFRLYEERINNVKIKKSLSMYINVPGGKGISEFILSLFKHLKLFFYLLCKLQQL